MSSGHAAAMYMRASKFHWVHVITLPFLLAASLHLIWRPLLRQLALLATRVATTTLKKAVFLGTMSLRMVKLSRTLH